MKCAVSVLALGLLTAQCLPPASAAVRVARVGLLRTQPRDAPDPAAEGLRRGLRELGWVEGEQLHYESRFAEGRPERLPGLAAELVRLNVDVIVTGGEQAILAAKQATRTIPIVMGASNDPVGAGLVVSLANPGGNVTGMTILSPELSRKRLELLKEVLPRLARVAVLYNPDFPGTTLDLRHTRDAAHALGLTLEPVEVRRPVDLIPALAATRQRAEALVPLADPFFTAQRAHLIAFTTKHRLPGMYYWREFVEAGGLMSYGPSLLELYRRAATHVDKILKGTRPGELPVEQPTKFDLTVNAKTAAALHISIPQSVLIRVDQVVQ
ncbi:MAG TPA: ABC transporter substrate-binding protein [Methylomirabilota bacterium]|nr:ABC transporter substrate-binding protein [Methylomirabilota bacterium]